MSDQHSAEGEHEEMMEEEDYEGMRQLHQRLQDAIDNEDGEEEGRL